MRTKTVIVEPYSAEWPRAFDAIRAELEAALGDLALCVEHVGSTSVPGLPAKPVIDIDIVIRNRAILPDVIAALEKISYRHEGDLGIPGREAFKYTDKPHLMKHHLYVCAADAHELHRHLTFRDFLRSHPEAAAEYGHVKLEGAARYPDDIDAYIAHKSPCIEKLYALCGLN